MSNLKRFILLGDAGSGKSSFINFLYNYFYGTKEVDSIFCAYPKVKLAIPCRKWTECVDEIYKENHSERDINDQTQSQTQKCNTYIFKTTNTYIEIIDTPGFNDTNGTDVDEQNLALIESALKEVPVLSGIILVVNGAVPNVGVSFRNFLHLLHQVWPNDLLNNCVAILTNCDGLSVNLDASVLQRDLNVDDTKKFYLQNSLFRWDRENYAERSIRRYKQDFEDNCETVKKLLQRLLRFENVSTEAFQVSAIKSLIIEKCISQSIHTMINLLQKYKEQQVAQNGIEGARLTMASNKQWEQQQEIHVIRIGEALQCEARSGRLAPQSVSGDQRRTSTAISSSKRREQGIGPKIGNDQPETIAEAPAYQRHETKIQVTIPDNEARSHYDSAKQQESMLHQRTQNLTHEEQVLSASMLLLLQNLKEQVAQLRSINKNYDIVERNRELLLQFAEQIKLMGNNSEMKLYYHETVNILSMKKCESIDDIREEMRKRDEDSKKRMEVAENKVQQLETRFQEEISQMKRVIRNLCSTLANKDDISEKDRSYYRSVVETIE